MNREKCSECVCKGGGVSTNAWVGDGFCQDLTNNEECDFDGGDCCGSCVNTKYCNDCKCLGEQIGEANKNTFLQMAIVRMNLIMHNAIMMALIVVTYMEKI